MATGKALDGKPYAGNPHVRFDEGEVAPAATPRRGSLLYNAGEEMLKACLAAALAMGAAAATACTGMYAGRKVSADGTVLIGRTVDTSPWTSCHMINVSPRVENTPGRVFAGKWRHLRLMRFNFWEVFWLEANYWKTIVQTLPERIRRRSFSLGEADKRDTKRHGDKIL